MDHIKTNIGHILLIAFLSVYGLEVISVNLTVPILEQVGQIEVPFDSEEEKEKNKNEEWDDEILFSDKKRGSLSERLSHQCGQSYRLQNIPLEIVTPPPECRS